MSMPPEQRAILDDILAAPKDDVPRLLYADWLRDHADSLEIPCPRCSPYLSCIDCPYPSQRGYHPERDTASGRYEGGWTNCKDCNSSSNHACQPGFILNPVAVTALADFISVQIELGNMTDRQRRRKKKLTSFLVGREQDLVKLASPAIMLPEYYLVRNVNFQTASHQYTLVNMMDYPDLYNTPEPNGMGLSRPVFLLRGGFVSVVYCNLSDFWKKDAAPGRHLCQFHPVGHVVVMDRMPGLDYDSEGGLESWFCGPGGRDIPEEIWNHLDGFVDVVSGRGRHYVRNNKFSFPALASLSRAILKAVKS